MTTKKKSYAARLGVLALALTLVSTCLLGGTLARYTSEVTGTGTANIAKWAVAFKQNDTEKTADFNFTLADTKATNANVATDAVAPGDKGEIKLVIDGTGSEVAYEYKIELNATDFSETAGNVKFYSNADYTTEWSNADFTKVALANVGSPVEKSIYWQWVGGEDNNANDTTAGKAAADITFTIKLTAQQTIATTPAP